MLQTWLCQSSGNMTASQDEVERHGLGLLSIPLEIRSIIYTLLFEPGLQIAVSASPLLKSDPDSDSDSDSPDTARATTTWRADIESWAISTNPELRCAQLLAVCRQIYVEAAPILYNRVFDLTGREAPQLLLHNIGSAHFKHIKRIVITWDTLEEFSRLLNKNEYIAGTSGLTELCFANWRIRHVGGVALTYRNVNGQERSMLEAARNIVHKHSALRFVAERLFVRRGSVLSEKDVESTIRKVKWRILASEEELMIDEKVLDLDDELTRVRAVRGQEETVSMPMMDPF